MKLDNVREHVQRLRYVKRAMADLKRLEEESRAAIEEEMGESEAGELDGELVITWKHSKVRRFNEKAFKETHPEEHAAYVEAREQRRFEVK
jgi:hypothetical protein